MRRKIKGRFTRGTTLVEVIVALGIVSLVLVSLWEGYNLATLLDRRSALYQAAAQEADRLLSEPTLAADGEAFALDTEAGTLDCRWQVSAFADGPLYAVTLVMTDQSTAEEWTFFTIKKAANDG